MSDFKWSGVVEEDVWDLDDEPLVRAGDRVYGFLNYYGETPYILGEVVETDAEYVAVESWYPVLPESLEVELFGVKVPFDRLRELATAEREGRVVVLNKVFQTPRGEFGFVYYTKDGLLMGTFHPTRAEAERALADAGNGKNT